MTKTSDTEAVPISDQNVSAPETVRETVQKPAGETSGAVEGAAAGSMEEIGGPQGPEPTRYGDWEKKGRCIDF